MTKYNIKNGLNNNVIISLILYIVIFAIFYMIISVGILDFFSLSEITKLTFQVIFNLIFTFYTIVVAKKIHKLKFGFTSSYLIKSVFITGGLSVFMTLINFSFVLIPLCKGVENELLFKLLIYTLLAFSTALYEESLFRGLILNLGIKKILSKKRTILTVIIISLIFALCHLSGLFQDVSFKNVIINVFHAFCTSVFLSAVYLKHNNIWAPIILHTANNVSSYAISIFSKGDISASVTMSIDVFSIILSISIGSLPFLISGIYILNRSKDKSVNLKL